MRISPESLLPLRLWDEIRLESLTGVRPIRRLEIASAGHAAGKGARMTSYTFWQITACTPAGEGLSKVADSPGRRK